MALPMYIMLFFFISFVFQLIIKDALVTGAYEMEVYMNQFVRVYYPGGKYKDTTATLSLKDAQEIVGGYVQCVAVGSLDILCDEEAKLKGKAPVFSCGPHDFVGTVCVGMFTDYGLMPVSAKELEDFESIIRR